MKSKAQQMLDKLIELFDKYPQICKPIKPSNITGNAEVGNQTEQQ